VHWRGPGHCADSGTGLKCNLIASKLRKIHEAQTIL
jgi:hypothetical protein